MERKLTLGENAFSSWEQSTLDSDMMLCPTNKEDANILILKAFVISNVTI